MVGDTIQLADAPALGEVLRAFPTRYHEPFYSSFIREDLGQRMEAAGLRVLGVRQAFLTKIATAAQSGSASAHP